MLKKIFLNIVVVFSFSTLWAKTNDSITYYKNNNQIYKAISFTKKQITNFETQKNQKSKCNSLIILASLFKEINDKNNALKYLFEAREIAEKNNNKYQLFQVYYEKSRIYNQLFEINKALKYLKESEKIALQKKSDTLLQKVYHGFYAIYAQKAEKKDSIKYYFDKFNYFSTKLTDLNNLYTYYSINTTYYIANNNPEKVKFNFQKATEIAKKLNDNNKLYREYINYSAFLLESEKKYKEAIDLLEPIENVLSKDKNQADLHSNCLLNLSFAYENLNNYKQALKLMDKHLEVYTSLVSENLNKSTNQFEIKYQIDKAEYDFKAKEKEILQKSITNEKLLLAFSTLFILAGFIFYFYYKNLVLVQKNRIKDIDNKLQYKIISATLDGQDNERSKISEVLHDNVSTLLSSVGLHLSALSTNLTDTQKNDIQKTKILLQQAHDQVRNLSHELVSPLLVKFGLQFALRDLCENYSNKLLQINFISEINSNKKFDSNYETKIFNIISELLNNVIKHSKATICNVNLSLKNEKLHIEISDNGIGFDSSVISKSDGFGLTQIKARIKNMNGKIVVKSNSLGTTIQISC